MKGNEIATFEDNEIIKALEWCSNPKIGEQCPKMKTEFSCTEGCMSKLMFDALALINRQRGREKTMQDYIDCLSKENENLKIELRAMRGTANSYKREVKRLENAYKQCAWERDTFLEELKTSKSEAVEDYCERVKQVLIEKGFYPVIVKNALTEIKQEMVKNKNLAKLEHDSLCETETYKV